jgi:hypothetical protein
MAKPLDFFQIGSLGAFLIVDSEYRGFTEIADENHHPVASANAPSAWYSEN